MKVNWRHPLKEKPKDGQQIFYIDWHWKKEIAGSYQVIGGTFERNPSYKDTVQENDEHGSGCSSYEWPSNEYEMSDCNHVGAWVPAEELNLPDWLLKQQPNKTT